MPTDSQGLRDQLLQTDDEFRQLAEKHRALEHRLDTLSRQPYLSGSEQVEEVTLKKRKLQLKDRMEDIMRRHRDVSGPSSGVAESTSPAQPR